MKSRDWFAFLFISLLAAFFLFPFTRSVYERGSRLFPEFLSFVKFFILATFGEMTGARIRTGKYIPSGFGLLPKAVVWGFLGVAISLAFTVFSGGVGLFPLFRDASGISMKILRAFTVSLFMNLIFAPVMMLAHKVTDLHISEQGGRFSLRNFRVAPLLAGLDWVQYWGFLMKKTIPFFWIPAHTITFLLPGEYRVLFAAFLSIFLGVFLGFGSRRVKNLRQEPSAAPSRC